MADRWTLAPDRYFDPNKVQRRVARELYESVVGLPILSPHGHVAPQLFSDPDATFGSPTEMLIIPDHYVFRMLYSQGISMDELGIPRVVGTQGETIPLPGPPPRGEGGVSVDAFGVDRQDNALATEALGPRRKDLRCAHRGGVDADLVCPSQ